MMPVVNFDELPDLALEVNIAYQYNIDNQRISSLHESSKLGTTDTAKSSSPVASDREHVESFSSPLTHA